MSGKVAEWRELADDWTVDSGDLRNAIEAACDRIEELEREANERFEWVSVDSCINQLNDNVRWLLEARARIKELEAKLQAAEDCLAAVFTPGAITEEQQSAYDVWMTIKGAPP